MMAVWLPYHAPFGWISPQRLPPIGQYIGTPKPAKSFEQHEIQDNFPDGIRLRPEGSRQSQAEARILGTAASTADRVRTWNLDDPEQARAYMEASANE